MLANLEDNLIKKIRKEKIKPITKSFFLIKQSVFYLFMLFLIFLSGLSLSILALIIKYGDWDIYYYLGFSPSIFYIKAFPYLWLFTLIIFLLIFLFKTKKADLSYKYNYFIRLSIAFALSVFLAIFLYYFGVSQKTENYLANSSLYLNINYLRSSWQNPELGLIAGTIIEKNNHFILNDLNNKEWPLIVPEHNYSGQEFLKEQQKVKIIGYAKDNTFIISEIRTWLCGCPHCSYMIGKCSHCQDNKCSADNFCDLK